MAMCRSFIVVLLLCAAAGAQQPASPPSAQGPVVPQPPADREDVIRLFEALRLGKTLELIQATMEATVDQLLKESLARHTGDFTPEQQARLDAFRQRNRERAKKAYPISEILEDFVPIYQKHFSKADVEAVIAFYESPVGQRLLDSQPEMMREGIAVITPKLQQRMEQLREEMRRDAEETFASDGDKKPVSAPPKKP